MPTEENRQKRERPEKRKRGRWWVGRKERAEEMEMRADIEEADQDAKIGGFVSYRLSTSEPEGPRLPSTCRRRPMLMRRDYCPLLIIIPVNS